MFPEGTLVGIMMGGEQQMAGLRTRRIAELTWQEFSEIVPERVDAVLLPVGTLEAHGVAALGTDILLPVAIAERVADGVNGLVAPAIPFGVTRSLLGYPGSTSVSIAGFEQYLWDVCESLADAGFRRVVILNGHGGNTDSLKNICFRLNRERRAFCLVLDWWVLCADETREVYGHGGGHAGTDETGMVLAVRPDLVRSEFYRPDMAAQAVPGVVAAPFPGSIILYENDDGQPEFDTKRAAKLFELVCAKVERTVVDVFRRWEIIGR